MEDERDTASLRSRHKKSSGLNLSCFSGHSSDPNYHRFSVSTTNALSSPDVSSPHFLSPSSWFRSKHAGGSTPRTGHRRRHRSADFSYDALSYSLNFDEGQDDLPYVGSPREPRRQLRDLELPAAAGRRGGLRLATMSPLNKSAPLIRSVGALPLNIEGEKDTTVAPD